ncbi:MBL fold metallo-hydrolase [Schinkia azotoformans]|uniref:MBL fold metallo-hydrolase n=1 Tax=Schinkia azotoformans TaxID=1454 RepID=UPI002DBBE1F6|nr:MBL fold metallo-hydrolase [Schinkia azotoformans]MEC1717116.1 MBL fold metallo-hydrolase [Schinkia azotoformans]MEC1741930.1 MBL fold metallo-hydrolase [Schinkia azotoformans]MEC1747298.1 MBL fold metallo-hydrolase [Schinkia azotoformans]MEC1766428.1 MBL fold metallo-hydrolase [Schinkia azotoformans]MEC1786392.1 MBL fold metallo-hydrolase [Schinkia azotoformans]
MEPIKAGNLTIYPIILDVDHKLKSFNSYLVEDGHSLSLIDAGMNKDEYWNLFTNTLHTFGFEVRDLTGILLTHHHFDHIGLVNRITDEVAIPVYAHKKAIPRLKRDPEFMQQRVDFYIKLYEEMGCGEAGSKQIDYLLNAIEKYKHTAIKAEITPLDKQIHGFHVIEVPGHSPDQVAFYNEEAKVLFGGDVLIDHISSNALIEPDERGERILSLIQQMDSLKKCSQLSLDYVFSGHGEMIDNHKNLIETRLDNVEIKASKLFTLIKDGASTASEIAQQYYKKIYELQFPLVMSEIIGHLDFLEVNRKVRTEKVDGVWRYYSYE